VQRGRATESTLPLTLAASHNPLARRSFAELRERPANAGYAFSDNEVSLR
jgi:hypothetical protein